jgi:hypothetical protein
VDAILDIVLGSKTYVASVNAFAPQLPSLFGRDPKETVVMLDYLRDTTLINLLNANGFLDAS